VTDEHPDRRQEDPRGSGRAPEYAEPIPIGVDAATSQPRLPQSIARDGAIPEPHGPERHAPGAPRCIVHVDMDAFYVNVELQRRPDLRGKPVVVAGSGPRAVVTTASYEARRFGVFSATPAARARRLCPAAVFLPPDFDLYRARSRDVMEVLRGVADRVEVMGLDEAYVDLTAVPEPEAAARRIKSAIRERTGLPCSVGIGPSKLVAKMASDAGKPDGFLALSVEEARARFGGSPPRVVPGIGPRTAERLERQGIRTVAELAAVPDETLAEWFGPNLGPWLGGLARFEDDRDLEPSRPARSESRETTFDRNLRDPAEMEAALDELAADLCASLSADGRRGRTIGIKIRLADFSTHTRARTLEEATNDPELIRQVARELLRKFAPARPVRLLGVRVAGFIETDPESGDDPTREGPWGEWQLGLPPPVA
jgi:DNA polymerase-4